jgi:HlyD family secretion protein
VLQNDGTSITGEKRSADFKVEITLEEESGLRPGLNATARITTAKRQRVLSIPIQALTVRELDGKPSGAGRRDQEKEGVFVIQAGEKADFVPLRVGIAGEKYFEVIEGLSGGEEVVSGNYQSLRELKDGDPIKRLSQNKPAPTKN